MPAIKIQVPSEHSHQDTFQRVKELLANDPGLRKLDSSYQCTFDEAKGRGEIKGKQFSAQVEVTPKESGSDVKVHVDLAFLLTPFSGQVKSTLERKLEAALSKG